MLITQIHHFYGIPATFSYDWHKILFPFLIFNIHIIFKVSILSIDYDAYILFSSMIIILKAKFFSCSFKHDILFQS